MGGFDTWNGKWLVSSTVLISGISFPPGMASFHINFVRLSQVGL